MGIGRYNATALTGNVERSLDSYPQTGIPHGSRAETLENGKLYVHVFNSASTAAHSSPGIIRPADYSGPGVWENQSSPFGDIGPTITATVPMQGDIRGGGTTVSGNTLTIAPCSCKDSTGLIPLYTGVDKTVILTGTVNQLFHIFMVRLVSDGSVEFRAYTTEAGVESDAQVDAWRWIDFWKNNGSGVSIAGLSRDGEHWNLDPTENYILAGYLTGGSPTLIDCAPYLPVAHVSHVMLGGISNTTSVEAVDIKNSAGQVISGFLPTSSNLGIRWNQVGYNSVFVPFANDLYYVGGSSYTTKPNIHAVRLRR